MAQTKGDYAVVPPPSRRPGTREGVRGHPDPVPEWRSWWQLQVAAGAVAYTLVHVLVLVLVLVSIKWGVV